MPAPALVSALSAALLIAGLATAPAAPAASAAPTATTATATAGTVAAVTAVRANQLGYLPDGPKRATVVSADTVPLPWQLKNASGAVVAAGATAVRGADAASGDTTHQVDFSSYSGSGSGFTVVVGGRGSHPFSIGAGLYAGLRSDTMSFFYQQRSGIPIEASLAGAAYARPMRPPRGGAEQGRHERALPERGLRLQP